MSVRDSFEQKLILEFLSICLLQARPDSPVHGTGVHTLRRMVEHLSSPLSQTSKSLFYSSDPVVRLLSGLFILKVLVLYFFKKEFYFFTRIFLIIRMCSFRIRENKRKDSFPR